VTREHTRRVERRRVLLGGAATASSLAAGAAAGRSPAGALPVNEPAVTDAAAALDRLLEGNRRFRTGHPRHPHQSPGRRHEVAAGQSPFAVVVGCADSRVPPEAVFDQGLGDLFVIRVAGNVLDDLVLGSVEFAVEEFDPVLLVVLGHERCGAVTATVDAIESGATPPGHLGAIVDRLRPAVEPVLHEPGDRVDNGVVANVRAVVAQATAASEIVAHAAGAGALTVVGARYDLDSGRVTLV
jgi:carbonic anhydrase